MDWRPIFDGLYEVSSCGRVRRIRGGKGARLGIELSPSIDSVGYYMVTPCVNGKRRPSRVHALVTEAFIGPRPAGLFVNHKDGNKLNNDISNLEYVTQAENAAHAGRIGLLPSGDRHWTQRQQA